MKLHPLISFKSKTFRLLKRKESSWLEKIVLSLHKVSCVIFFNDELILGERTNFQMVVNKKTRKSLAKTKEVIYSKLKDHSNLHDIQELRHENNMYITEIVAKKSNECICVIQSLEYKNSQIRMILRLVLGFIEWQRDMVRVHYFHWELKLSTESIILLAQTISFQEVVKNTNVLNHLEPVHGIIIKNSKKEKKVMRHS
ncbi:hypothetical protein Tco_0602025 [Tanacetum coccineum]